VDIIIEVIKSSKEAHLQIIEKLAKYELISIMSKETRVHTTENFA
jgi:hypothetical protein